MTTSQQAPESVATPSRSDTRVGERRFADGVPDTDTATALYDHLDFQRGVDAFLDGYPGVSMMAIRRGMREAGVADGSVVLFSGLMDSRSLFLTGNADTVYFWTYIDLSNGPVVLEAPPQVLALIDDMWFRWVIDVGLPGPDRGEGGRFLIVGPEYDGPLPDGGVQIAQAATNSVGLIGRAFLDDNDPGPAVERIKRTLKMYPYVPGTFGTSIADFLAGGAPLKPLANPEPTKFIEGTAVEMNTLPPSDFSFFELLDELVQEQPASALDPEIAGQLRAIGIVKGQPFQPDARMRAILEEAAVVANATARTIATRPRDAEGFAYYHDNDPNSRWVNSLFVGGSNWIDPPAQVTPEGVKPSPTTGARALNARTWFFYVATGDTPAMCMFLTGVGSQYLLSGFDAEGAPLDGGRRYELTLPPDVPAERFWSMTLYDNQTRSMLQTEQRFPRAGSQSYPTPAASANDDGSTTIVFSPERPEDVDPGNWIQTVPGKGWFGILRLYSPKQPFFDKTWRPSEIEPVG